MFRRKSLQHSALVVLLDQISVDTGSILEKKVVALGSPASGCQVEDRQTTTQQSWMDSALVSLQRSMMVVTSVKK